MSWCVTFGAASREGAYAAWMSLAFKPYVRSIRHASCHSALVRIRKVSTRVSINTDGYDCKHSVPVGRPCTHI